MAWLSENLGRQLLTEKLRCHTGVLQISVSPCGFRPAHGIRPRVQPGMQDLKIDILSRATQIRSNHVLEAWRRFHRRDDRYRAIPNLLPRRGLRDPRILIAYHLKLHQPSFFQRVHGLPQARFRLQGSTMTRWVMAQASATSTIQSSRRSWTEIPNKVIVERAWRNSFDCHPNTSQFLPDRPSTFV